MDIPPLFCLHQLLGIWDVSTFWLLWIILLGILTYKFLIILGRCVGVELLNYTVILCLTCLRISNCFPQELYHFTLPPTTYEDSNFSTSFSTLVSLFFFFPNRDHPNGCEAASTSLDQTLNEPYSQGAQLADERVELYFIRPSPIPIEECGKKLNCLRRT